MKRNKYLWDSWWDWVKKTQNGWSLELVNPVFLGRCNSKYKQDDNSKKLVSDAVHMAQEMSKFQSLNPRSEVSTSLDSQVLISKNEIKNVVVNSSIPEDDSSKEFK